MKIFRLYITCFFAVFIASMFNSCGDGNTPVSDKLQLRIELLDTKVFDSVEIKNTALSIAEYCIKSGAVEIFVETLSGEKRELKKPVMDDDEKWRTRIIAMCKSILNKSIKQEITNEEANRRFTQIVNTCINASSDEDKKSACVIAGYFPTCYDDRSADDLISNIEITVKNKKMKSELVWCISDTRQTEAALFTKLKSITIIDKRVPVTNSRFCDDNSVNKVLLMLFQPIESAEESEKVFNSITTRFGSDVQVSFYSEGMSEPKKISGRITNKKDTLYQVLQSSNKAIPNTFAFGMKYLANNCRELADSIPVNVVFVGDIIPSSGFKIKNGDLDAIKKHQHRFLFYLTSITKSETVNAVQEKFKEFGVKYEE